MYLPFCLYKHTLKKFSLTYKFCYLAYEKYTRNVLYSKENPKIKQFYCEYLIF